MKLRGVDPDIFGLDLSDPRQLCNSGNYRTHTRNGDVDVFAAGPDSGRAGG